MSSVIISAMNPLSAEIIECVGRNFKPNKFLDPFLCVLTQGKTQGKFEIHVRQVTLVWELHFKEQT